jgi:hemin uptake protein HemP
MSCEPNFPKIPTHVDSGARLSPAERESLSSTELLQGRREVLIRHGEEMYRLRLTRNGKLILHK